MFGNRCEHLKIKGAQTHELSLDKMDSIRNVSCRVTNKPPDRAITTEQVIPLPQTAAGMIKGAILGHVGETDV